MNPDVAQAIRELSRSGILPSEKAAPLLRIAQRELVSVFRELRLLRYLGVLFATAGAGLLIEQNYQHIGPIAIAVAVGFIALASLGWVAWKAPSFSWGEVAAPSPAFEYILLLGVLLGAADLAFIEYQFTPLGSGWPWHLLIVSLGMAFLAFRFDSSTVFSLALSTFAAWRGVSTSLVEEVLWHSAEHSLRWNAIACGILFALLGRSLAKHGKKGHFEPIAVHLGWLLILGALASGGQMQGARGIVFIILLGGSGISLSWVAFRRRRFALFAFGILGTYIAASQLVLKTSPDFFEASVWFAASSALLVLWLWRIQRKMKEPV